MKKNFISVLALVLAVVSLGLSVYAFTALNGAKTYYQDRIFELTQKIGTLEGEIDTLYSRVVALEAETASWEWSLEAAAWEDRTGADVTVIASPDTIQDGTGAMLIVRRGGQEILRTPCQWGANCFSATASLSASDGYGYYLLVTYPDGGEQELLLSTPENPLWDIPVNLASSLTATTILLVNSWEQQDDLLVLTSAHAAVTLPRLSAGEDGVAAAQLVLTHNGAEVERISVTLDPSEVEGSFDQTLSGISFTLPQTQPDDVLELYLEVELTNGQVLTAYSTSWYLNGEELYAVVG